jgi:Family of unknown function (DUF6115)
MPYVELKLLVFVQIGIDMIVVIAFLFLLKRLREINRNPILNKGLTAFESLLSDANHVTAEFAEQLQEKKNLIKRVNEQLDGKVSSLTLLLNRADVVLSHHPQANENGKATSTVRQHEKEIVKLAKKGLGIAPIADALAISKEEVKLVLDFKKKMIQLNAKEGSS